MIICIVSESPPLTDYKSEAFGLTVRCFRTNSLKPSDKKESRYP